MKGKSLRLLGPPLIKIILKLPVRTHLNHYHFKEIHWLPVNKRVTQLKLSHVHQIVNGNAPSYLSGYFIPINTNHTIRTRSSQTPLVIPRFNTSNGKSSFRYSGAIAWNSLPIGVQTSHTKSVFKPLVKQFLFDNLLEEESSLHVVYAP